MAAQPEDTALAGPALEAWRALVVKALRRSGIDTSNADPIESLLRTTTYDGITIEPLYGAAPDAGVAGRAPYVRGARAAGDPWHLIQQHDEPDPNDAILADLEGGASGIWLRLGAGGVAVDGLAQALEGVYLDLAPIVLDAGPDGVTAAQTLLALAADRGVPPTALRGNLGLDPLGDAARSGESADLEPAIAFAVQNNGPRSLVADGLPFHEAGGSDAQELGATLAAAVAYLRALTDAGLSADAAAGQLEFRYAATADQFLTIAKLRAARRVWSRVGEVVARPWPARLHAVTSPAMLTRRDPWVNLLRAAVACFAASAGGADAVTVLPFDTAIGRSDAFARRIARNTATLLREEAHVDAVIDPAGGSGYVESLTESLAQTAWAWFQEIEAAGGLAAALKSGLVADRLAATRDQRQRRIATRADPITGVSEFPLLDEEPVRRQPRPVRPGGGLPVIRYAEEFESLRDRADSVSERPTVFLATLGPVAAHTAAAGFAANMWNSGGIAAVNPGPLDGAGAAATAFIASRTRIACICPPADMSTADIAAVATAMRSAGAREIWLVREPSTMDNIDGWLYTGCDALAVLTRTLAVLEVP